MADRKIGNFVLPETYRKPYEIKSLPDQGREVYAPPLIKKQPAPQLPNLLLNSPIPKATTTTMPLSPITPKPTPIQYGSLPYVPQPTKPQPIQYGSQLTGNNIGGKQVVEGAKNAPLSLVLGGQDIGKNLTNAFKLGAYAAENSPGVKFRQALFPSTKEMDESALSAITTGANKAISNIEEAQRPLEQRIGSNPVSGAIRSLPNTLVGLGLSAVNPAAGAGYMSTSAFGGYGLEAEKEGASTKDQIKYGLTGAALETATELPVFSGMLKFFKNGVAKESAEGVLKGIVKNSLKEGAQEALTEVGTTTAKKAIYAPDTQYSLKQIADAGLSGAIMSVMLLGLGSSVQATQNKVKQMAQAKDFSPKSVVEVTQALEQEYQQPINEIIDIPKANSSPNTSTGKKSLQVGDVNKTIQPTPLQTAKKAIQPITQPNLADLQPNSVATATTPQQNAFKADLSPLALNRIDNTKKSETGLQSNVVDENVRSSATKYDINKFNTVEELEGVLKEIESRPDFLLDYNLQMFAEKAKEKLTKLRKTYSNSLANSQAVDQRVLDAMPQDAKEYTPTSNQKQWDFATKRVEQNTSGALSEFMATNKLGNQGKDTALAEALIVKFSQEGNFEAAADVATKLSKMATEAGQAIQAISILKRLTPEGMLYYANKTVNDVNVDLPEGKKVKLTEEENKQIVDTMRDVQNKDLSAMRQRLLDKGVSDKQISGMTPEQLANVNTQLALQTVSNKIPQDFTSKQQAIRRIMMLANPKTQVRNIVGNMIMTSAENTSQVISAGLDKMVSAITGQRQTLLPQLAPQAKGFYKGLQDAIMDYKLGIDSSNSGGGAYEVGQSKQVFKSKALNKTNNFLSFIMTLGDRPFYQAAYNQRIAEFEKMGYELNDDLKLQAHEYALDKVFQNDTEISSAARKIKNGLNEMVNVAGFGLGDMAMPFTKTPANILRKGVQYSPAGVVSAVKSFKGGQFNQKQFTDSLARSLTGTSLITLGYLLAKAGLSTGDYDRSKDREGIQNLAGETNYSFKIGDTYYSFDWAQPISIPLSVGIDLYNAGIERQSLPKVIEQGIVSGGGSLLKQSMLQGLTRMMGGFTPAQGIVDVMKGSVSQYVPTLGSQIAKTADPYQRKTDGILEGLMYKIPGARNELTPKLDVFGNKLENNQGRGVANKIFENFLFPGNVSKQSSDTVVKELLRLSKNTSDNGFLPNVAPKSFTYKGETYQLDLDQQNKFQELMGKENYEKMKALMLKPSYKLMTDIEKAKELEKINKKSYDKAKEYFIKDVK